MTLAILTAGLNVLLIHFGQKHADNDINIRDKMAAIFAGDIFKCIFLN